MNSVIKYKGADIANSTRRYFDNTKMPKIISPEKCAQIIAALKNNPNAAAVAREIGGVSHPTVWKIAKRAGIELTATEANLGRPKIPSGLHAQIIAALKDDPSSAAVAREIGGVSQAKVWKIAKDAGIELTGLTRPRPRISPELRAQIIAALKNNPNAAAVARETGVSQPTVWKTAKRAGIELTGRTHSRIPSELHAQIIAALKNNPNAAEVAREIGVGHSTVWRIAKDAGIELTDKCQRT